MCGKALFAFGEHGFVQGVSVGVHSDDGGEILDFEFPYGFRGTEFFEKGDAADLFDALGEDLGRAAYSMKVDASMLFAGGECAIAHPAFADDAPQSEISNDFPLIRFFAD
jgi:hypothetical protein